MLVINMHVQKSAQSHSQLVVWEAARLTKIPAGREQQSKPWLTRGCDENAGLRCRVRGHEVEIDNILPPSIALYWLEMGSATARQAKLLSTSQWKSSQALSRKDDHWISGFLSLTKIYLTAGGFLCRNSTLNSTLWTPTWVANQQIAITQPKFRSWFRIPSHNSTDLGNTSSTCDGELTIHPTRSRPLTCMRKLDMAARTICELRTWHS